jgi:hypothetical protein
MKHHPVVCLAFITTSLLTGCAMTLPDCYTSYVQYHPVNGELDWESGREQTAVVSEDITVYLQYQGIRNGGLLFDMVIENKSQEKLTIDPVEITLKAVNPDPERIAATGQGSITVSAIDPEAMLVSIEEEKREADNDYNTSMGLNLFASILTGLGSLSDDTDKSKENMDDIQENMTDAEIRHRDRINFLNGEQNFISRMMYRKTTIRPGESTSGYLLFPLPLFHEDDFWVYRTSRIPLIVPSRMAVVLPLPGRQIEVRFEPVIMLPKAEE